MKHLSPMILAVTLALATPLRAQDNPVVVELFTSQGCSSCPAADALLHEIAGRDDVIALALHVDYWDYIGWKDPFGNPAHSDRQRAYAQAGQRNSIYTPEMIVNGSTDIVGAKAMALSDAIADHARTASGVALTLRRRGGEVTISAQATKPVSGPMTVHLLRYTPSRTTEITRGENGGRTYDYANVVEGWTVLGQWQGDTPLAMTAKVSGDNPVVVIVQAEHTGPILAAGRIK